MKTTTLAWIALLPLCLPLARADEGDDGGITTVRCGTSQTKDMSGIYVLGSFLHYHDAWIHLIDPAWCGGAMMGNLLNELGKFKCEWCPIVNKCRRTPKHDVVFDAYIALNVATGWYDVLADATGSIYVTCSECD